MVEGFKEYMNLVADKKCPDGFKFDSKLQVCVPKGHKYIRYPYFGEVQVRTLIQIMEMVMIVMETVVTATVATVKWW